MEEFPQQEALPEQPHIDSMHQSPPQQLSFGVLMGERAAQKVSSQQLDGAHTQQAPRLQASPEKIYGDLMEEGSPRQLGLGASMEESFAARQIALQQHLHRDPMLQDHPEQHSISVRMAEFTAQQMQRRQADRMVRQRVMKQHRMTKQQRAIIQHRTMTQRRMVMQQQRAMIPGRRPQQVHPQQVHPQNMAVQVLMAEQNALMEVPNPNNLPVPPRNSTLLSKLHLKFLMR
jgi:hypothetical protein